MRRKHFIGKKPVYFLQAIVSYRISKYFNQENVFRASNSVE